MSRIRDTRVKAKRACTNAKGQSQIQKAKAPPCLVHNASTSRGGPRPTVLTMARRTIRKLTLDMVDWTPTGLDIASISRKEPLPVVLTTACGAHCDDS